MDIGKHGKSYLKKAIKAQKYARRFAYSNPYGKRARRAPPPKAITYVPTQAALIGRSVGYNNCKACETVLTGYALMSTRTLYNYEITNIPPFTTDNNCERENDQINLRGFKLNCTFENTSQAADNLIAHFAVVKPRYISTISTVEFFKSDGISGAARGIDFSTTLDPTQFDTLPINTDRFIVLLHKKFNIGRYSSTFFGPAIRKFNTYLPLNRQLQYEPGMSPSCTQPIYIVFWCDKVSNGPASVSEASMLGRSIRVVAVFKEPSR